MSDKIATYLGQKFCPTNFFVATFDYIITNKIGLSYRYTTLLNVLFVAIITGLKIATDTVANATNSGLLSRHQKNGTTFICADN